MGQMPIFYALLFRIAATVFCAAILGENTTLKHDIILML